MAVSTGSAITTSVAPPVAAAPVSAPSQLKTTTAPIQTIAPAVTGNKQPLLSPNSFLAIQNQTLAAPQTTLANPNTGLAKPTEDGEEDRSNRVSNSDKDTEEDETAVKEQDEDATEQGELTEEELRQVEQLQQRDAEVRRHEQAHASVGGQYAGPPQLEFTVGPDGRRYATGGEVRIDSSPVPGDPEATIRKLQVVRRAALAPADPSPQDQRVASEASQGLNEAQADLRELRLEERRKEAEELNETDEASSDIEPEAVETEENRQDAEGGQGNRNIQFNPEGVSSAQAASAFDQASRLSPATPNGVEIIQDNLRAIQISA